MFNIEQFLIENNIKYYTTGKDVASGNVNIRCPFCGENDRRWHMGINIDRNWYGCWKDSNHRGKDISYLIAKLLNCSLRNAKNIVYGNEQRKIETDLSSVIRKKLLKTCHSINSNNKAFKEPNLSEFDTFKTIISNSIYYRYLQNRGFDNISLLINKYNLKFAQSGSWKGRIIFPVYINNELVTWQGRDVTNNSKLKYKDLSKDESVKYLKQCIYNFDSLTKGGKILYITEGMFDVLKVDFYTPSYINATCLYTKTATEDQYKLLFQVMTKFKKIRILLDQDARKQAYMLKGELSTFHKNIKIIMLRGIKDAGEMTKEQIRRYLI